MQKITIRIDAHEYQILQGLADYWLRWCYAHFNIQKSRGVEPEPIVGCMFQKYFSRIVDTITFPRSGKVLSIEYYEAKAFQEVTVYYNDLPTVQIRAKIDKGITDWKPSLSKPTMRNWYDSPEADSVKEVFGELETMGEVEFEVVNNIFNQNYL